MRHSTACPQRWLPQILCILLLSACDSLATDPPLVSVRDSAGIQIVENLHNLGDIPVFASIDANPVAEIGVMSGNPDQEFGSIQGAILLSPDRILIADGQARELSVFSTDGHLIRRFGGAGDGPGEFRFISQIGLLSDDSVIVWDRRGRRITIFPISVGEPRLVPFEGETASRSSSTQFLRDGTLLSAGSPPSSGIREYPELTLVQDSMSLARLTVSGEVIAQIGTFFSSEKIQQVQIEGSVVRIREATPPFPRYAAWVASEDHVFLGDNRRFQIDRYDLDGRLQQRIRVPGLERPLAPQMVSELMERQIEEGGGTPEVRRMIEQLFNGFPLPERTPAFTDLVLDDRGFLWVREYHHDWTQQAMWYVFDARGYLTGKVSLPPGSTVFAIGQDHVLLRPRHELDVPMVRLHRVHRN